MTRELILVLVAGVLLFSQLDCALQEPEETLYAEIPRQMLVAQRWLVPVRHGQDYYDKPPLLYWLVMAAYSIFGVHDWAARLVPAAAAFLCVVVSYAWGKRTIGAGAAFAGALMLCLSPRFAQMARMLTMNSLLTLWVVSALAAAHIALAAPILKRRWWLLSAALCGLGVLTKGPVALVLVAAPVLVYRAIDRRIARIGLASWLVYLGVTGAIALPWFVLVAIRDPFFIEYFVWTHHIRRFLDPIDHHQPVWYYLPLLFVGMLPWSLLLPAIGLQQLRAAIANRTTIESLARRASEDDRDPRLRVGLTDGAAVGLFVLSAACGFAFFSASVCKRPSYILPVMPPLALILGYCVDNMCRLNRARFVQWTAVATITFAILFVATEWGLPRYADRFSLRAPIAAQADTLAGSAPVLCFPHGWDGVNFYLQRGDVHVFRSNQLGEMMAQLDRQSASLVVVKLDDSLQRFVEALPDSLEFAEYRRQGPVVVGWVRQR